MGDNLTELEVKLLSSLSTIHTYCGEENYCARNKTHTDSDSCFALPEVMCEGVAGKALFVASIGVITYIHTYIHT